jgi:hypothetical protein
MTIARRPYAISVLCGLLSELVLQALILKNLRIEPQTNCAGKDSNGIRVPTAIFTVRFGGRGFPVIK